MILLVEITLCCRSTFMEYLKCRLARCETANASIHSARHAQRTVLTSLSSALCLRPKVWMHEIKIKRWIQ